MIRCLKSELYLLIKRKYFWIISLLLLIPTVWFLSESYSGLFKSLAEEVKYTDEVIYEIENNSIDYDLSTEFANLTDIMNVVNPGNCVNNIGLIFLGIGLILFPIFASILFGLEYNNGEIHRKIVEFGAKNVFIAKSITMVLYIVFMYGILIVVNIIKYRSLFNANVEVYKAAEEYVGDNLAVPNYSYGIILVGMLACLFYSVLGILITQLCKNAVAGIVGSVIICYGEPYISNGYMPKWLFSNVINSCVTEYEHSFASFSQSAYGIKLDMWPSLIILAIYLVIVMVANLYIYVQKRY